MFSNKQIKQIGEFIVGLSPTHPVAPRIAKASSSQLKGVKRGVTTKRVTAAAGKRVNVKKKKGPAGK
jgi:hypothetical protein